MPGTLQQALLDVADLANDKGHETALNLAGERQLSLFAGSGPVSTEDLAFRLYLDHGDVFAASHARVQSQEARRFVDFHPRQHVPLVGAETTVNRVLLTDQLSRWFAARNRSEFVEVRVSESPTEVSFVIIHGLPPRNLSVIASPSRRDRMSFIPDKQDIAIFDKATGRLSINAQYAAEHDFYRKAIGRVYFGGNDEHFEPAPVVDLTPLLDDPAAALSVQGLPRMHDADLLRIELQATDPPYDTFIWSAKSGLKAVYARELPARLTRPHCALRVRLALHPVGARRPRPVELAPPCTFKYDRRTHDDVIREFLFVRGLLHHPNSRMANVTTPG
jgi:hypothetical protein